MKWRCVALLYGTVKCLQYYCCCFTFFISLSLSLSTNSHIPHISIPPTDYASSYSFIVGNGDSSKVSPMLSDVSYHVPCLLLKKATLVSS